MEGHKDHGVFHLTENMESIIIINCHLSNLNPLSCPLVTKCLNNSNCKPLSPCKSEKGQQGLWVLWNCGRLQIVIKG